jgi:hypothetical protein
MTSPKAHALRFRIWQFAAPREWDVTTAEIAEALGEPWQRVRNALAHAGWAGRVRGLTANTRGFGANAGATRAAEGFIVRDILASRVNSEFTA